MKGRHMHFVHLCLTSYSEGYLLLPNTAVVPPSSSWVIQFKATGGDDSDGVGDCSQKLSVKKLLKKSGLVYIFYEVCAREIWCNLLK